MPQVTVKDQAFHDPRLRLASALLNVSRATLGWELISVWSLATDRNSPIMKPELIGAALERDADQVVDVFVTSDLAKPVAGELDLSPMASLFGDCYWLQRTKDAAPAAGKARAQDADKSGQRGPDGRFLRLSLCETGSLPVWRLGRFVASNCARNCASAGTLRCRWSVRSSMKGLRSRPTMA